MSTIKFIAHVGMCFLLGGCVPVTGVKSVAALSISVAAMVGAWFGFMRQNHEHVVCQKARDLDNAITIHEEKYHRPESTDVTFEPAHPADKIAKMTTRNDAVSRLNQGM